MELSKNITYIHAPMSQNSLYLSLNGITKAYAYFNIIYIIYYGCAMLNSFKLLNGLCNKC